MRKPVNVAVQNIFCKWIMSMSTAVAGSMKPTICNGCADFITATVSKRGAALQGVIDGVRIAFRHEDKINL
jgi:hypothetical protein